MTALLVMTDGRDHLDAVLQSLTANLDRGFHERWIHDDSGDEEHRGRLREKYPSYRVIGEGPRRGFAGAIAHAWSVLAEESTARFVFHLEDDFMFRRKVPLSHMEQMLRMDPRLMQIALQRQPWNEGEIEAGTIYLPLESFLQRDGWILHRRWFTTNPSLYPMHLCLWGWPVEEHSEGKFSTRLFGYPSVYCGYLGGLDDEPWVEHIGHERSGEGY